MPCPSSRRHAALTRALPLRPDSRFRSTIRVLIACSAFAATGALGPWHRVERAISPAEIVRTWTFVNRSAVVVEDGVSPHLRLDERPGGGLAWTSAIAFTDGDLTLELRGRDLQQQSFLGIAFHVAADSTFDVVWLRPFNFRAVEPARRLRAVQFASYPRYSWQRLREDHPGQFEAGVPADVDPDGWVRVRVEVRRAVVRVYLGDAATPLLSVTSPAGRTSGGIGLWVGDRSPGDFRQLRVRPTE